MTAYASFDGIKSKSAQIGEKHQTSKILKEIFRLEDRLRKMESFSDEFLNQVGGDVGNMYRDSQQ